MTRVCDLEIGDEFNFVDTTLIVRKIDKIKSKVLASKRTAHFPHGIISLSFYSPKYEDLLNRVELTSNPLQLEVSL